MSMPARMADRPAVLSPLPASIEVSARQAAESDELPTLLPRGVRVYVPDLGNTPDRLLVRGMRRLSDLGYIGVPHIAARRIATHRQFEDRVKVLTLEGGVRDMLLLGGGLGCAAGPFASTMDMLDTGLLDRCGVKSFGIAGHPEGSPDFSDAVALEALRSKAEFGKRSDADVRIVTQFGFDGARYLHWVEDMHRHGIDLPIHIGVAGPAKVTTLLRYAASCGVGNSITFLRKRATSLAALAGIRSAEEMVQLFERDMAVSPVIASAVRQIHVFAFGGIEKAAQWLRQRGSWS